MNNTKFKPIELASTAFYTVLDFSTTDTIFRHGSAKAIVNGKDEEISTKHLYITHDRDALPNANCILKDYFASSQYQDATHKKFHIIDLDEYDYDAVSIKLIKTHLYKPVSSLSKCQKLTRVISRDVQSVNGVEIDPVIKMAFDEMLEPDDFFKFQELRTEFRISISIVKNRKVIDKIKVNIGYFTLIVGSKPYDFQEDDSKQKNAARPSLSNPVFKVDGIEFMAIFNDSKKYYRDAVDMLKI
ncbi:hypothetical protein ACTAB1_01960 [Pseudomonas fragariae (ex Marin et al. 2024)]|uniref:hypothetical protein n=1 Tax=Pseudomonas TaxID=286 RepID=UPI000CD1CFBA|nr:hypothetical protein [Pseudomonas syringae]POD21218.1 hypothetical protein BKM12_07260 [Pseudomonas syringae pv. syringae]UQB20407.1 hypothetical protein I9H08_00605 [Pseudomonas syringae pv. syringae]